MTKKHEKKECINSNFGSIYIEIMSSLMYSNEYNSNMQSKMKNKRLRASTIQFVTIPNPDRCELYMYIFTKVLFSRYDVRYVCTCKLYI